MRFFRPVMVFSLAAALLLAGCALWAAPAEAGKKWTITPDQAGAIGQALSQAGPGDLIQLTAGTFRLPDRLSPANSGRQGQPIIITGAGPGKTIVQARGNKYGFYLNNKTDVIIQGMTLTGFSGCGIKLIQCKRCILDNLDVLNSGSHNIWLYGSDNNTVSQCVTSGSKANGITISPTESGAGGRRNLISSNTAQGNANQGILVTGTENLIKRNLCQKNGTRDPFDHGIYCIGRANRIVGNVCRDNPHGSGLRIGSKDHEVRDNTFAHNGRSGVVVAGTNDTANLTIVDNLMEGNNLGGVEINALKYKPDKILIKGNILRRNRANLWIKAGVRRVVIHDNLLADPLILHVRLDAEPGNVQFRNNRYDGKNCKFSLNGQDTAAGAFLKKFQPGGACGARPSQGSGNFGSVGPGAGTIARWPRSGG